MFYMCYHFVICFIILLCLFNPAFRAAILNKPLIDWLTSYEKLDSQWLVQFAVTWMQVRRRYGCFDEVVEVEKREVRHCNWVRFLQATTNMNDVNLVARRVNKRPQFQIIKPLPVNAELKVCCSVLQCSKIISSLILYITNKWSK